MCEVHTRRVSLHAAHLRQKGHPQPLLSIEPAWQQRQQQQQLLMQSQLRSQLLLPTQRWQQPPTPPQPEPLSRQQPMHLHAQPLQPLGPGVAVRLGERHFRVTQPLGKGSFGVVWAAEDKCGRVVALKEIPCKSESELGKVMAEGGILEQAGQDVASAGLSSDCIPALVSTEVERTSQQEWRVRLAMSLVPGISLESFLEARRKEAKTRGPWSVEEVRIRFGEACMCAGELLKQLAPIVDAFSASVYHRDITPRNIQIQEQDGRIGNQFGLVDFGLAVDAKRWRAGERGAGDLGGDGRYWPASSWFVFCHGTQALLQDSCLLAEYRTGLDAHSLGLTALRCLVEMLPGSGAPGQVDDALQNLRAAWQRYWHDARKLWQPIFDAFRGKGDFDTLRSSFTRARVYTHISDDLCAIRAALRAVQQACRGLSVETGLAGMPALCEALLLMVQAGRADDPLLGCAAEATSPVCLPAQLRGEHDDEPRQCSVSTASPSSSPSASASSGTSC